MSWINREEDKFATRQRRREQGLRTNPPLQQGQVKVKMYYYGSGGGWAYYGVFNVDQKGLEELTGEAIPKSEATS